MTKRIAILLLGLLAGSAFASDALLIWPDGSRRPYGPKSIVLSDGRETIGPSIEACVAQGDYRMETPEEVAERHAAAAQAQAEAEAQRIDNKSDNLKQAENRFISAILAYNAEHPESPIELTDGFLEIDAAIEGSSMNDNQKVKFALRLRTYWDLVLFHGGRFGDVQYHPEVEE